MLLWEALSVSTERSSGHQTGGNTVTLCARRLPYDKRCTALTRSGTRCRGRIHKDGEFCVFHDPELTAERRRRMAANGGRRRRRLSHLPDGYLRKLTNAAAVGNAMDRLYREVRLGIVTTEMGTVLFNILTRLFDSGLAASGPCPQRTKAARIRPRLSELLTRDERTAWQKAIARTTDAAADVDRNLKTAGHVGRPVREPQRPQPTIAKPVKPALQAAS